MSKHVLLWVETNKQARTDTAYVNETINYYYDRKKSIYRIEELETKTHYNSSKVLKKTKEFCQYVPKDDAVIIYCIDVDNYQVSIEQNKLFESIKSFCTERNYELVLFCKDVEDVYWREQIQKNEKKMKAQEFIQKKLIVSVNEGDLRKDGLHRHGSNVLTILDKYMVPKADE